MRLLICFISIIVFLAYSASYAQSPETSSGGYSIVVSEFMFHADSTAQSQDWVELYNYGASAVNISNWKLKDENIGNTFTIPSGTTINPGNYLVLAQRLDTFQMVYPSVTNVIGSFAFGLDNTSDQIRLLDASNTPVIEFNYIDSTPWYSASDGLGPSLQIKNFDSDPNDPNNWFPGCIFGTPGEGYTPCDYPLIVSEINYNSAPFFQIGDWIELYNRSAGAIDLSNWQFRDQQDNIFLFPVGTILNSGARLVVSDSLDAFAALFPGTTNIIGEFSFSLSNGGDAVVLYDNDYQLQYSLRFNDTSPWPLDPDGEGYTLEFNADDDNPNIPENWIAGCPYGSPGIPFTFPCPTLSAESIENINILVFPNPFADYLYIDISEFPYTHIAQCYITNITGQTVIDFYADSSLLVWNNNAASGMYLLHLITTEGMHYTQKIIRR